MWILQFHRAEVAATLLTLVAISIRIATVRTFAHDITVGKELMSLLVIVLLALLFNELTIVIEFAEEVGGKLVMCWTGCTAIHIKGDTKLFERILYHLMIAITNVLWGDTFFLCTDCDWHTMLVTATDKDYLTLLQSEITYIDIGWNIHTSKVSYMYTTISVWQCRRNRDAFEFLFFHICLIIYFLLAKLQ